MSEEKLAPVLVAVDDGFRQIKLLSSDGHKVSHLSVAKAGFSLGGAMGADLAAGVYRTAGADYTVDHNIDGESTRYEGYATSEINRVLVHHALHIAGLEGREITLATGLPLGTFFGGPGRAADAELIAKKKANLAEAVEAMSGKPAPVIRHQEVVSQGLMAYADYALQDDLSFREGFDSSVPVAVVDIGGGTTDTATIVNGDKVDFDRSGTINKGVLDVFAQLQQRLRERFKLGSASIPAATLEHFLRTGKARVRGAEHDISDDIHAVVGVVLEEIRRELKRRIGEAALMQAVVLVGGGANLFADGLREDYPHLVVPEDPEFANARGMLKMLRWRVHA